MRNIFSKINNKFIYIIITLIIIVFGYSLFSNSSENLETHGLIVKGQGFINDTSLEIHKRVVLSAGDTFKTVGDDSMGIIEWGDGSITRLGGNSEVVIKQSDISGNNNFIKISFELINGRTWSNIISFIGSESYFVETFSDTEAAVRGTVFNVDYLADSKDGSIQVNKHEVDLSRNGELITIGEGAPVGIISFKMISDKFNTSLDSMQWNKLNLKLDNKYIAQLKKQLGDINELKSNVEQSIKKFGDNISGLSDLDKEKLYSDLLSQYQKINFINADDLEFFKEKQILKGYLLELGDNADKESIFKSSIYDLRDAIKIKSVDGVNNVIDLIGNNYDDFSNLGFDLSGIDFKGFLDKEILEINKHIKSINSNMLEISNNVGKVLSDKLKNMPSDFINTSGDLFDNINDGITDSLKGTINIKINR